MQINFTGVFMKKLILMTLTLLTCGVVQALPVGNPADPMLYTNNFWFGDCEWGDACDPCTSWLDMLDVRLGFYGDYVFNRRLEAENNAGTAQTTTINTSAGLFVFNICDWIDLFATVGVSNFYSRSTANNTNAPGVEIELGFSPTMSYSGGGRIALWNCDCFHVGIEGQYFYSKTELDWIEGMNNGAITYFNSSTDRDADYKEWQVALAASYIFVNSANFSLIPYAAVQFAGVSWDLSKTAGNASTFQDQKEQQVTGWTLGVTALMCDLIGVSVEGRWANEKAISVIGQLSF